MLTWPALSICISVVNQNRSEHKTTLSKYVKKKKKNYMHPKIIFIVLTILYRIAHATPTENPFHPYKLKRHCNGAKTTQIT